MENQNQTHDENKNEFKSAKHGQTNISTPIEVCIDNCTNTYKLCSRMITYCLEKGGEYAKPRHIELLQDCARICGISANFMIRGSDFYSLTCAACAKISLVCAESCEAFTDDEMMKSCAEACRKSAESCEEMCVMQ